MNELDFKIPLTNYFMNDPSVALNFEFPFDYNRRRCDLLVVSSNEIIGIEIKSDIDNLDKLEEQLDSYYKCFNKVYVACGQKHYASIKKLDGDFGIIYITRDELEIKRKPKVKKKLSIFPILDMCDKALLEKWTGIKSSNKSDLIIQIDKKLSKAQIYAAHRNAIFEKVSRIFEAFISERGAVITREDITLLSLKSMDLGSI
ncbi:sce7726 family protein [Pantoea sp.]|uniref:sce7726 family protein n=1 Tax=Pantoea sp. TaxID=69393 RepID=UPI0031DCB8C0